MNKLWQVRTEKFINEKEAVMRSGNVYQIANGYMGYRGTLDEFGPEQLVGITLAGLFDRVGNAWREPVNAPNGGFTEVTLEGVKMSALTAKLKGHRQSLNLENAVFERETTFSARGKNLTLKSSRFLSAADPHLGVIQFSVTCDRAAKVVIRTGIDFNIWDLNGPHLLQLTPAKKDGMLLVQGITNEAAKRVAVAEALENGPGKETQATSGRKHLHVIRLDLAAGKTYSFQKYFAVYTDNDPVKSPGDAALRCVREAKALGYAACLARHNAEWAKQWARCDVKIEGDDEAQLALRFSIFQLLIVAPVGGSANSIPARALSGQVYKGAIFWDTEMFMFPFFLHTHPETAAELLRYRIRTLAGARRKARTEGAGYRGAFYAWESQETGDEACTYFNIGDPVTGRDLRTYFRDKQVHISGDIAVAMWKYFQVTGDDSLLLAGGAEVILECARFYYSYAYLQPGKNRYEILDVTGPDEYHERVNNEAFTSMAAKVTFEIANATIAYLKRQHPAALQALLKKLKIAGELPQFTEAAKLLYVPQPDRRTGVIEQFDGYFRLEDTTVEAVKARKIHPDEYLGGGQGVAVQTRVIKQADVVMMLNLFKDRFSKEVKKANWEYYEPRTEHGSSLSACAYAMVAADIGKLDWAYKYFLQTAKIDLEAKYKVYVGTIFMGGSHPAANGGAWMTAVFGFGGLTATENQITLQPRLCKKWRKLEFNAVHRGDRFKIGISRNSVRIDADAANRSKHKFVVAGKAKLVAPGASLLVKY
jgi:kojibiose phosphorylase